MKSYKNWNPGNWNRRGNAGFGWKEVMDLGDISGARAQEMHLALWVRLYMKLQTPYVNVHVAH